MKHTASIPNRAYELSQLPPIQLELSHLRFHILDISYCFPPCSCINFKYLHILIISLQIIEVKGMLLFNFDIFREREVYGWIIRRKSSTCWRRCRRIRRWNGCISFYCIYIWENSEITEEPGNQSSALPFFVLFFFEFIQDLFDLPPAAFVQPCELHKNLLGELVVSRHDGIHDSLRIAIVILEHFPGSVHEPIIIDFMGGTYQLDILFRQISLCIPWSGSSGTG